MIEETIITKTCIPNWQCEISDIKLWESEWFIPLYFDMSGIHYTEYWIGCKRWALENKNTIRESHNSICALLPATVRMIVPVVAGPGLPTAWHLSRVLLFSTVVGIVRVLTIVPLSRTSCVKMKPLSSKLGCLCDTTNSSLIYHSSRVPCPPQWNDAREYWSPGTVNVNGLQKISAFITVLINGRLAKLTIKWYHVPAGIPSVYAG